MMISLSNREQLNKLLELGANATPGQWRDEVNTIKSSHGHVGTMFLDGKWSDNAPFVAEAKNSLPAIMDLLREAGHAGNEAELIELRAYVRRVVEWVRGQREVTLDLSQNVPTFLGREIP